MKYFSLLLASSLVPSAYALGRAILINECNEDISFSFGKAAGGETIQLLRDASLSYPINAVPTLLSLQTGLGPSTNTSWRAALRFAAPDSTLEYSMFNLRGRGFADYPITATPKPDREDCPSTEFGWRTDMNEKVTGTCAGNDVDLEIKFCKGHCVSGWVPCNDSTKICCTSTCFSTHCSAGNSVASNIWLPGGAIVNVPGETDE